MKITNWKTSIENKLAWKNIVEQAKAVKLRKKKKNVLREIRNTYNIFVTKSVWKISTMRQSARSKMSSTFERVYEECFVSLRILASDWFL
jgi:hypothetical protein